MGGKEKVPKSEIDLFDMICYFYLAVTLETNGFIAIFHEEQLGTYLIRYQCFKTRRENGYYEYVPIV